MSSYLLLNCCLILIILGEEFKDHPKKLQGNNDFLCVTRPDIVYEVHKVSLIALNANWTGKTYVSIFILKYICTNYDILFWIYFTDYLLQLLFFLALPITNFINFSVLISPIICFFILFT